MLAALSTAAWRMAPARETRQHGQRVATRAIKHAAAYRRRANVCALSAALLMSVGSSLRSIPRHRAGGADARA